MSGAIWESRLDNKYDVSVVGDPDDSYRGTLRISSEDKVLLEEPVGVSYGAPFGPDVDDVAAWQERAVTFIDGLGNE